MNKKTAKLCKWKREDLDDHDKLIAIIAKPKYFCAKCSRAARKIKWLCQPLPLKTN